MDMEEEAGGLFWQAKAYHRYSGKTKSNPF